MYVAIKQLPTGASAEMDKDQMMFEVGEEVRKRMLIAGLKKAINPKPTDLGF